MFTNATYFPELLTDALFFKNRKNVLVIDDMGKINATFAQNFLASDPIIAEEMETNDLTTAAILYAIATREGKQVGMDNFNGEIVIAALIKHMRLEIQNKRDTAIEIYMSWHHVTTDAFAANSYLKKSSGNEVLPDLIPIQDFQTLITKKIFALSLNLSEACGINREHMVKKWNTKRKRR